MFQQTPVYDRLVAERGDVPVQVRGKPTGYTATWPRSCARLPPPAEHPAKRLRAEADSQNL
ncbi:hypothetical protein F6456_00105 [Streptomyces sp. LBUM 1484]|nr:hypothetical protein [Streptomyces sp. LBUM 1484]